MVLSGTKIPDNQTIHSTLTNSISALWPPLRHYFTFIALSQTVRGSSLGEKLYFASLFQWKYKNNKSRLQNNREATSHPLVVFGLSSILQNVKLYSEDWRGRRAVCQCKQHRLKGQLSHVKSSSPPEINTLTDNKFNLFH